MWDAHVWLLICFDIFFYKQKSAYEIRISDWSSDVCSSDLPGTIATYTNNWPPEPLAGNFPTPENILWSLACVVILIAGVGTLIWGWAFLRRHDATPLVAAGKDPLTLAARSEERRVGKACVSKLRSWWAPYHLTNKYADYPLYQNQT